MFYFTIMDNMNKTDYNNIPVFYCKNCLSLKIFSVDHVDNSEYCDECGSTDIEQTSVENWNELYKSRYGHSYLDKY